MTKKKSHTTLSKTKQSHSNEVPAFFRQDPNDPRTYAGRKREHVHLGGLGDDGLLMTRNRMNAHRILNICFVGGLLFVAVGVALTVSSLFQGATIDACTMKSSGGPVFNGIELATALRLEALYAIIIGTLLFSTSFIGFHWLYDKQPLSTAQTWSRFTMVLSLGWAVFFLTTFSFPDPLSLIAIIILICFAVFSSRVERDKTL